jgi:Trk K+ transport system NAD-binding subunit
MDVEEVTVEPGASCVGQRIAEIAWPRDCVIATLRRESRVIFPHGDTVVQEGDILVVVAEGPARQAVRSICKA